MGPVGGSLFTLTLTSSTTSNTGTNFQVFTTANSVNATAQAQNLAAAINRNLSSAALDRFVGVASANTVTIYLLTPDRMCFCLSPARSVA